MVRYLHINNASELILVAVKSPVTRPIIERLIGRGLPWAEGEDHKRQRYQLAPFFS